MNSKRVDAAAAVLLAAVKQGKTLPVSWAYALESACLLQSPESAAEQVELRDTLAKRTELLRDVQAIARRRFAEATGRKAYGDRLKAENAEMQAELHETRKEVRAIRSWVSENTPFSGAVPGQVLRTLAWLHGSYHSYRSQVEKQYAKDQETLAQLRKLEERIAELEAERHSTNEALSDAMVRIAELKALTPAPIQTCRICGAGYTLGQPCSNCEFQTRMAAELRRIEAERPEAGFSHRCGIPLVQRLDCGHCPHEVCQDCERCPHFCQCGTPPRQAEDPHDSPLHQRFELGRDDITFPHPTDAGSAL